jgi:hypothetical protein
MITVTYFNFGQRFTIELTIDQARQELIQYGYPGACKMNEAEVIRAINEIY